MCSGDPTLPEKRFYKLPQLEEIYQEADGQVKKLLYVSQKNHLVIY